jgi:hypothetical protein
MYSRVLSVPYHLLYVHDSKHIYKQPIFSVHNKEPSRYQQRPVLMSNNNSMDHIILSVAVALIVVGLSFAFYLLFQEDTVLPSDDDILKMAPSESNFDAAAAATEPAAEDSTATLERLMAAQDRDISAVKGHTDMYDWTQSASEVEVYMKVGAEVSTKAITVDVRANSCRIVIDGQVRKEGELFQEVLPDDCNWQMEGTGEERRLWITLVKRSATKGNQHWKSVFRGDPPVDLSAFGPPVHAFDSNNIDKAALRQQMAEIRGKK